MQCHVDCGTEESDGDHGWENVGVPFFVRAHLRIAASITVETMRTNASPEDSWEVHRSRECDVDTSRRSPMTNCSATLSPGQRTRSISVLALAFNERDNQFILTDIKGCARSAHPSTPPSMLSERHQSRPPPIASNSRSSPTSPSSSILSSPAHSKHVLRHLNHQESPNSSHALIGVELEDPTGSTTHYSPYAHSAAHATPRSSADSHRPLKSASSTPIEDHRHQHLWRVSLPPIVTTSSPLQHYHPPSAHRFHSHTHSSHNSSFLNLDFRISILDRVKPWLPFILWAFTSIGFLLAITVFRTELFQGLDNLSHFLRSEGSYGHLILFLCIFLTTFPPLPLYSTLIVLSGYTFGPWHGFAISYAAALSGAVVVYFLSRRFLYSYIEGVLNGTGWVKRVVRTIERRPQLLFLIRVAPYPYNLLNAVLAVSPTLSFRTYFICTALSLFKLIIHTSAGSTIKQFAEYHTSGKQDNEEQSLTRTWSIIGISLCVAIFLYLSYLAHRAVKEEKAELDEEAGQPSAMSEAPFPRRN